MMLVNFTDVNVVRVLAWVGFLGLVVYPIGRILYNLTFHPLARYPGPLLWRIWRLPYLYSSYTGFLHIDIYNLHMKYGDVVRIAPDELSFADSSARECIHSNSGGSPPFPKSTVWHSPQVGRTPAITNAFDRQEHTRLRRKMEPAFNEKAVQRQEPIIHGYVDLFLETLREKTKGQEDRTAVVDIVKYFTFVTVDIIGDMAFGESFHCLESDVINDWVGLVYTFVKATILFANLRYYPWLNKMLLPLVPKKLKDLDAYLWDVVKNSVEKRLRRETDRPDFIELWQKDEKGKNGLTRGELESNSLVSVVGGSETSATTLSAAINYLVRDPERLSILTKELRDRFKSQEEITFAAVKQLPYLNAVLLETFRVSSAMPSGFVRFTPAQGAEMCGNFVPRNTFVSVHEHTVSFKPTYWHDASSYIPERWLPESRSDPQSPFFNDNRQASQPFSSGPRSCIGKLLGWANVRTILAKFLWAFDVAKADTPAGKILWENQKVFLLYEKEPFEITLKQVN